MKRQRQHETFDPQPIRDFMKSKNLSQKQMAKMCGFSVSTLRKLLNGQTNVSMDVMIKILVTMKIRSVELFGW